MLTHISCKVDKKTVLIGNRVHYVYDRACIVDCVYAKTECEKTTDNNKDICNNNLFKTKSKIFLGGIATGSILVLGLNLLVNSTSHYKKK